MNLEEKKYNDFMARAKKFLAEDPYWMYLLTLPGGRQKRRKVAQDFAKVMTTIPKVGERSSDEEADDNGKPFVLTRSIRRSLGKPQVRA